MGGKVCKHRWWSTDPKTPENSLLPRRPAEPYMHVSPRLLRKILLAD